MIAPRSLRADNLVLSHFTLDRNHPVDDRITAAAAAGFDGIGLYAGQFIRLRDAGFSIAEFRDLLDAAGVCLAEIEVLSGWGSATPTNGYWAFEATVWELVDTFESRYVQAIGPYEGSIADAAERFGAVCDRAADHGAVVGLEFVPFTNVVDAADALAIVEAADRPNGGVCVDIWHHARGANDLALIRAIPPELVVAVQMSDGPAAPTIADYKEDCLRYRVPPGDGQMDAVEFVRTLIELGADAPWSLEVCNDDVWGRSGNDHVQRAADGMRNVLAEGALTPRVHPLTYQDVCVRIRVGRVARPCAQPWWRARLGTGGARSIRCPRGNRSNWRFDGLDHVIEGGTIVDGSGAPPTTRDIGVSHGVIVSVGDVAHGAVRHYVMGERSIGNGVLELIPASTVGKLEGLWREILDLTAEANADGASMHQQGSSRPIGFVTGLESYRAFRRRPTYVALAHLPVVESGSMANLYSLFQIAALTGAKDIADSQKAQREMLLDPHTITGLSDAGAHVTLICDATMPTTQLTYRTRDRRRGEPLPLEFVVAKQTSNNARLYGLHDRGLLAAAMRADINVIDLDNLTVAPPTAHHDLAAGATRLIQPVQGYPATMVKGEVTRSHDADTGARPGTLVRS